MSKERFTIIPGVFLLLIKNNKILLARRYNTGYEDGNYNIPGGHVEGKETLREAMAREAKEEIGITVNPENLKHVLTTHRWCDDMGGHEQLGFYFIASEWEEEITNTEPEECDDIQWFSLNDLPENIIPHIRAAIEAHLKGDTYAEFGWHR